MPCYQTNIVSIDFKPENEHLLRKALQALGWTITKNGQQIRVSTNSGTITIENGAATGRPNEVNTLRVAYSNTVVAHAAQIAKAKGWNVQTVGNKLRVFK